jgi:hypothetical protein
MGGKKGLWVVSRKIQCLGWHSAKSLSGPPSLGSSTWLFFCTWPREVVFADSVHNVTIESQLHIATPYLVMQAYERYSEDEHATWTELVRPR